MLSSSLRRIGTAKSTEVPLVRHVRHATTSTASVQKTKYHPPPPKSDINRIKSTAKTLIAGAKQARNPEWRHTYKKKGELKMLEQDLLANRDDILQSGSDVRRIEEWTMEAFLQSGTQTVQPGTFFEIRRNAQTCYGVVISSSVSNIGHNEDTMSMNTRGEVFWHRSSDIMFAIPNFVDTYLVERCGRMELHEDQHQLAARLRALKAAREFDRVVEKEQYRLGRAIQDVYSQVRASDPDEWGRVTTMQVARMLEAAANVPIVTLFAVHRQLMDRPDEFICHPTRHRFVHTFDVRPLSHLKNIKSVKQMLRDNSPVIRNFQEKAKFLIDRSRELAAQSAGEPPSRAEIVDHAKFTPKEQEIIAFLKLSMLQGRRIQEDSFAGNVPAIIKDTFRYNELITAYVTLKFLREIGVYTPWEDMATKDRNLHIPENVEEPVIHPVTTPKLNPTEQKVEVKTPGLVTADLHESVRHDFGNLPVYVIDDVDAEELDDGISVERVPDEPESVWLHVHVADPTAFIPITHPLSRQIQKRSESYYFAHHTWPMLPDDVAQLADMGRADARTQGQNVLSFSAKIGSDGQMLDYKIRAARVRNVHKLKYDDVNGVLLPEVKPARFTPFEPKRSELWKLGVTTSYVRPHAKDLKLLHEVTRRLVKGRLEKNVFVYAFNAPEIEFLDKPIPENPAQVVRPILHRGYPRLRYHVVDGYSPEIGSRSLVAECMKIAGRVASRFCLDHNIPAVRRAMPRMDIEEACLARLLAARNELGFVDVSTLAKEGISFHSGELTSKPLGHWLLGISDGEGYVRTTSPLRRGEDMIMHWQIKSALLPDGGSPPPIDEYGMDRMLEDLNGRKQMVKKAYRAHARQWAHEYIQNFMAEQERAGTSKSPKNPLYQMDGYVTQNPVYNFVRWSAYQDVYIPKLGLTAVLPVKKDETVVPVGSLIKVNAKEVFQYDLNHTLEVTLA